jgi:hypothetical protein
MDLIVAGFNCCDESGDICCLCMAEKGSAEIELKHTILLGAPGNGKCGFALSRCLKINDGEQELVRVVV